MTEIQYLTGRKGRTSYRPTCRRRGTAVVEFVMLIPLLAFLIALIFFFGWAMMHQQHVKAADRYRVWRGLYGISFEPGENWRTHLNETFFRNQAESVHLGGAAAPDETIQDLIDRITDLSLPAGELAHRTVGEQFPHGRGGTVGAGFPTDVGAWRQFQGPIRARHVREGEEWYRGQVSYLDAIRDQFLMSLDDAVLRIPDNRVRENLRRLYLRRW